MGSHLGGTVCIPLMWPCCEEVREPGAVSEGVRGCWPWETSQTCRASSPSPGSCTDWPAVSVFQLLTLHLIDPVEVSFLGVLLCL